MQTETFQTALVPQTAVINCAIVEKALHWTQMATEAVFAPYTVFINSFIVICVFVYLYTFVYMFRCLHLYICVHICICLYLGAASVCGALYKQLHCQLCGEECSPTMTSANTHVR